MRLGRLARTCGRLVASAATLAGYATFLPIRYDFSPASLNWNQETSALTKSTPPRIVGKKVERIDQARIAFS